MKIKRLAALILAVLLLCSATGCKEKKKKEEAKPPVSSEAEKDPNWPVSIGDIRIPKRPERIVSLSPALTELLCELGANDRLAGVSDFCDYPTEVSELPQCGSAQLINRDQLEEIKPELVVTSSKLANEDTIWLQQMGAEVVTLPRAQSVDTLGERYVTMATAIDGMVDGEQAGEKISEELRARYSALANAAQAVTSPLNGIYLRGVPLMMATGDTFEGEMLTAIGLKNDAEEYTNWDYPADKAAALYPKIIFYDREIDAGYFKTTQIYNTTDAYKQNKLFPVDSIAFERQSARMLRELEKMFTEAYPDLADRLDTPPAASEPADSTASDTPADSAEGMLDISDATTVKPKK